MVKKLILVTSPPACGKTYISKALAARLEHVVYLDKDTLITLSKQIFKVANQPYNRSSQFFEDNKSSVDRLDDGALVLAVCRRLGLFRQRTVQFRVCLALVQERHRR